HRRGVRLGPGHPLRPPPADRRERPLSRPDPSRSPPNGRGGRRRPGLGREPARPHCFRGQPAGAAAGGAAPAGGGPDSGDIAAIRLAGEPGGIAAAPQGVWVSSGTGQLLLVDARTNTVTQSVPIGNGPQGVAFGGGAVWVANTPDGTVSRFDPGTGRIRKIAVGGSPTGVAYGDGEVWVAAGRSGNVLRIDASS